jgi:hypothetical protein
MDVIHATKDPLCCSQYGVNDPTFVCAECGKTVGYCMGCDDDYPDICSDCWVKHGHRDIDDDPITASDIAADLAPLSHEECERRGIRHSSEDT